MKHTRRCVQRLRPQALQNPQDSPKRGGLHSSGAVAAEYVYDPYGGIAEQGGPLSADFTFGFSPKLIDRETGLVSYQRRFYRPAIGRWINRDPIEEEGGDNLYAFCANAPVFSYDPNDEQAVSVSYPNPSSKSGYMPAFFIADGWCIRKRNRPVNDTVANLLTKGLWGGAESIPLSLLPGSAQKVGCHGGTLLFRIFPRYALPYAAKMGKLSLARIHNQRGIRVLNISPGRSGALVLSPRLCYAFPMTPTSQQSDAREFVAFWTGKGYEKGQTQRFWIDLLRVLAATGPMADTFFYRFSTKYLDPETGFYYYGCRFYAPELGRWINRDPAQEKSGINLYFFCRNNPILNFDLLGMIDVRVTSKKANGFWGGIIHSGDRYSDIVVNGVDDIIIYRVPLQNAYGYFYPSAPSIVNCGKTVEVSVLIKLDNSLVGKPQEDVTYIFTPHSVIDDRLVDNSSSTSDSSPFVELPVLLHEKGHAKVFLQDVIPSFKRKLDARFPSGTIPDDEENTVRTLFIEARKEFLDKEALVTTEEELRGFAILNMRGEKHGNLYYFTK